MPVGGSTVTNHNGTSTDPLGSVSSHDIVAESKGAFSLGFQGALGIAYGVSDNLSIFGEFSHVSLRIKGKTTTITSYKSDGVEIVGDLNTIQTDTEYVDEVSDTDNMDVNSPHKELNSTTNYNSLFINLGVKFNF